MARQMRSVTCVGGASLALLATSGAALPPQTFDVYVLAGQSNMSGRGALTDLTPSERSIDANIRVYSNDGKWHPAVDPLDDATGQIDAVSVDRQAAVGPGLFFARTISAASHRPVAVVPCAKGGTTIGRWAPGGGRDTLYGSCIARIREAGGHVAGILWYQGESDAEKAPASAARWRGTFATIVAAFRADLKQSRLPIAFVQLSDKPTLDALRYPSWEVIRQQQMEAGQETRCVTMVPAAGLPRNSDDLHLSTAAQRELGARLAKAMQTLTHSRCR